MLWFFLIISTLGWGIAEIFYKKGNLEREKYSHLKTTVFVGIFFGIYATGELIYVLATGNEFNPFNFILYLPVAACYIGSMMLSYFGVRFIEESISDPIENTSGAMAALLSAIFLHESLNALSITAVVITVIGILGVGFAENSGKTDRKKILGKKLAIIAFAMPFFYAILDSVGTFLDIFYTDDVASTLLVNVNEDSLEHVANICYEYIFFLVSIGILIFLRCKKVKLFSLANSNQEQVINEASTQEVQGTKLKWYQNLYLQRNKILAALFETIGQSTYLFALSEGVGIAAVIIGAGTVIISLILSRIILKEKLSVLQYIFVFIILLGIILLSLA